MRKFNTLHHLLTQSPPQNHLGPTCNLEELLGIFNPATGTFCCVGWAPSKRRRCTCAVAQHNQRAALAILDTLPRWYDNEHMLWAKLKQVASLGLCVRFHQDQAAALAGRWYRMIVDQLEIGYSDQVDDEELEDDITRLQRELEELIRRREEQRRRDERRREEGRRSQEEARRQAEVARREEERQREEAQHEAQARREEEARQQEQEEARQQEEAQREREEARQRRENSRRPREARQRADAQARTESERLQRESLAREWTESWTRYERDWNHMRRVNTTELDEDVRESVPWPVKSGRWQDVNEANVRAFFRHAPDEASENPRRFRSLLLRQGMDWHEDRLRRSFPRIVRDEECLRLANVVMQVVNDLRGPLSSL